MTVPSEAEFIEYLAAVGPREKIEFADEITRIVDMLDEDDRACSACVNAATAFVDQHLSLNVIAYRATLQLKVHRWLVEQRCINEGFSSLDRKNRKTITETPPSRRERIENIVNKASREAIVSERRLYGLASKSESELDALVADEHLLENRKRRLKRHLERVRDLPPTSRLSPMVKPYFGYFYGNDVEALRAEEEAINEITESAVMISTEIRRLQARHPRDLFSHHLEICLKHAERALNPTVKLDTKRLFLRGVLKRKSPLAKERVLAHSIYFAFRSVGAAALTDFLQVEGVKNMVDQRTVERWLADWKQFRADKNIRPQ